LKSLFIPLAQRKKKTLRKNKKVLHFMHYSPKKFKPFVISVLKRKKGSEEKDLSRR